MTAHRTALATATLLTTAALALTGCSDDETPSSAVSKAASALQEATAKAGEKFDDIKSGVDVKDDVSVGTPDVGSDGRASAELTVHNTADAQKSFLVQVEFTDGSGNVLDTVAVTVSDVPAGATKKATARGNRSLSGSPEADVPRAVRY
ncbi:FxLYD domain-containing protein [Streptomyces sp. NPDC090106]|uniref:FxLYD domain-containing protein n=1 Tax=Streptomyces sp. NPDC090106 TaxID=3365946 RepID=UPI0037FA67F6